MVGNTTGTLDIVRQVTVPQYFRQEQFVAQEIISWTSPGLQVRLAPTVNGSLVLLQAGGGEVMVGRAGRNAPFRMRNTVPSLTVAEVQIEISPSDVAPLFLMGTDSPANSARPAGVLEWQRDNNAAMTLNATHTVVLIARETQLSGADGSEGGPCLRPDMCTADGFFEFGSTSVRRGRSTLRPSAQAPLAHPAPVRSQHEGVPLVRGNAQEDAGELDGAFDVLVAEAAEADLIPAVPAVQHGSVHAGSKAYVGDSPGPEVPRGEAVDSSVLSPEQPAFVDQVAELGAVHVGMPCGVAVVKQLPVVVAGPSGRRAFEKPFPRRVLCGLEGAHDPCRNHCQGDQDEG